jgi:hypothetical protein
MPTTWGSWAATARDMTDNAWGGTLTVQNLDDVTTGEHPVQSVSVSGMGIIAGVEQVAYATGGPGAPADPGGLGAEALAELMAFSAWYSTQIPMPPRSPGWSYWIFKAYVTAPGPTSDAHYYCLGVYTNAFGPVVTWYGPTSLSFGFTAGMTNCVLKVRGGDSHPDTCNTRDFIDQHMEYAWHATAEYRSDDLPE